MKSREGAAEIKLEVSKKLVEIEVWEAKFSIWPKTPDWFLEWKSSVNEGHEPMQNAQKKGRAMQMWRVEVADTGQVFNLAGSWTIVREITINGCAREADK